jgi:hypothetical protein
MKAVGIGIIALVSPVVEADKTLIIDIPKPLPLEVRPVEPIKSGWIMLGRDNQQLCRPIDTLTFHPDRVEVLTTYEMTTKEKQWVRDNFKVAKSNKYVFKIKETV